MGHAPVIQFAGLRIDGLSGIYDKFHFDDLSHFERPPFKNKKSVISIYPVRSVDMFRLKQLKSMKKTAGNANDIFVSHD
ncbi:hypothetical protein AB6A40_003465 [Gnathostoma spinigerum]|uniref:Uncharacterized protein n=1 Tax=Gnathostoma spinigerum TaxID=75299 RepID=A0ABD6EC34_9BILA